MLPYQQYLLERFKEQDGKMLILKPRPTGKMRLLKNLNKGYLYMPTIKKRISLNLSQEDLRIIEEMKKQTGENVNTLVKKALFYYYITNLKTETK